MADFMTPQQRSCAMSKVRGQGTGIEKCVRSLLHRMGFRFRLHAADIPGKPDIVLPRHKTVIFVHGCFWHQHPGCSKSKRPVTRAEFWAKKLDDNMRRDESNIGLLESLGWRVIVVWECETRNPDQLASRLNEELRQKRASG